MDKEICLKLLSSNLYIIKCNLGVNNLSSKTMSNLEDGKLVNLCLAGQRQAFEMILRRYQKIVYNIIFQMIQSHEETADLTQETFLKAYKALSSFKQENSFKPWLLKIATNLSLSYLRDVKRKPWESLDSALEDNLYNEPQSCENIEKEIELKFTQMKLMEALNKLNPRQREVFLLRYQYDLSISEIASIVDETESATKSILFRIREKLRNYLLREQNL